MTQITVERITPPAAGKRNAMAKVGMLAYSFDPSKIDMRQGETYDVDAKQSDRNPNMYFVDKAKPVTAAPRTNGASYAPGTDRWYMPFVSNTVAHAISAGLCQSPAAIREWARAAKSAAVTLDAPEQPADDPRFNPDDPF